MKNTNDKAEMPNSAGKAEVQGAGAGIAPKLGPVKAEAKWPFPGESAAAFAKRTQLEQQAGAQGVTDEQIREIAVRHDVSMDAVKRWKFHDVVPFAREIIAISAQASAKEAPAVVDGLPPLPEKVVIDTHLPTGIKIRGFTADQMHAYVLADRKECARKAGAGQAVGDDYITVQKLQEALAFWLPSIPTRMGAEDIAARIEHDSWLLVGAAGDVKPGAEDAGWISLNPAAVAQEPVGEIHWSEEHGVHLHIYEGKEWTKTGTQVFTTPPAAQAGDARDAARYRWLRERSGGYLNHQFLRFCDYKMSEIDAAIDAAISAAKKGGTE